MEMRWALLRVVSREMEMKWALVMAMMGVCISAFVLPSQIPERVGIVVAKKLIASRTTFITSCHSHPLFSPRPDTMRRIVYPRALRKGGRASERCRIGILCMGGYEVSSATEMGTEYTFLAAKCFVNGEVQPAQVKVENEKIVEVKVLSEAQYAAALVSAPKFVLPLGPEILLCPAFVNAHTHLAMGALRGITDGDAFKGNVVEDLFFRVETNLEPEDVRAFVRMGCWEAMLAGTGAVWEHYYFGDAIADAFLDTGITGAIAPTLQDLAGPGLDLPGCDWQNSLRTTLDIAKNETLRAKGIVAALGPHATDTVSPGLWKTIAAISQERNLPIHSHVAQSIEEYQRIRKRHACTPVQLLKATGLTYAHVCSRVLSYAHVC